MNALLFNIADGKSMTSTLFSSSSFAAEAQENVWTEIPREPRKMKDFSYRGQMWNICQHWLQLVPVQLLPYQLGHRCTEDGCALKSAGTTREMEVEKLSAAQHSLLHKSSQVKKKKKNILQSSHLINEVRWVIWLRIHSFSMQLNTRWLKRWASSWNVLCLKEIHQQVRRMSVSSG